MPSTGSRRLIAIITDFITQADGIHISFKAVVTWESNCAVGYFEAVVQPTATKLVVLATVNNAAKTFAQETSGGLVYTDAQIFLPAFV